MDPRPSIAKTLVAFIQEVLWFENEDPYLLIVIDGESIGGWVWENYKLSKARVILNSSLKND